MEAAAASGARAVAAVAVGAVKGAMVGAGAESAAFVGSRVAVGAPAIVVILRAHYIVLYSKKYF